MTISSKEDLAGMTRVGKLVGEAIREMKAAARPGMTTAELDRVGADFLRRHGARSAPQLTYNFPGFNLISVNEQIVHGVPGPRRLEPGDVVKIDVTAEARGIHRRRRDHRAPPARLARGPEAPQVRPGGVRQGARRGAGRPASQ